MEQTQLQKHIDSVLAEMQLQRISTDDQYQEAAEFLRKAKQTARFVEDQFGEQLEEAREEKRKAEAKRKAIDEQIKRFTTPLDKAEKAVKRMMSDYQIEVARKRKEEEERRRKEEEERRLAEAIETNNEEILNAPPEPVEQTPQAPPKAEGTYTVETWHFEIVDKHKINPDYLIPNEKLIGQIVRSEKSNAKGILGEGVRVYSTQEIRARV